MKVWMFGWEFPPHISGGLGTACHGIPQALASEKVDVLFVVPTLIGDEKISCGLSRYQQLAFQNFSSKLQLFIVGKTFRRK